MQDSQFNNEDSTEKCDEKYKSNNLSNDDGNSCVRLREKKHIKYLQRISGVIHYGGAPRIEILGKELFPKKFKKNFNWKRLTSKETAQLENELAARAKWRNDFSAGCIQSMEYEILTVNKENICNKCMELNSDKNLKVITNLQF
ncbi:unnamed protein product [Rhizophagus irregularis]|nr:unnamed protein product [Rhizophagus irregularis]